MNEKEIITKLSYMLNECLESVNQDNSFKVKGIEDGELIVAFDIVIIEGEVMFSGY